MENTSLLSDSIEDIQKAAELILGGSVVGIPTETVYGLGADALNPMAVKKIFAAKGRPADNPLIVHIYSIDQVQILGHDIPDLFYTLAEKFWPGPLTMIVPKNDIVPLETSGGLETVGIRMPSHPVMRELIRLSKPVAAPSANRSGYPSPTKAEHVINDMNGKISAVIDGGECRYGVESTVISFENENTIRILRPGSVTKEMLSEYADDVIVDKAILNALEEGRTAPSPGMKYKHYSPKADVILIDGDYPDFCRYVINNSDDSTYCLIYDSDNGKQLPCHYMTYGSDGSEQAHNIFARLREIDNLHAKKVYVRSPEKDGVGLAVYNRLLRAAGFEVIKV
ncbi:L-threonylcarbamoyladenylate synthase [Porcipelethomonas sp.]|uniref:L-threonylcarbamoyladenylate synthase n=1 Tax=Porcipelethomonas sp. TaxID=2981675 RepID=UPI003EF152A2